MQIEVYPMGHLNNNAIGTVLLRKYYTIFNMETNVIGFAEYCLFS